MITFGIITAGGVDDRIKKAIGAIRKNRIPEYQIVVVGPCAINESDVEVIASDSKWIGEKKNVITRAARFPLIAYFHDYLAISDGWWDGVKDREFDIGITRMKTMDGGRFRDWTLDCMIPLREFVPARRGGDRERMIPYHVMELSNVQYISGAYWIARKEIMEEFPVHSVWGEDAEWSQRVRKRYRFSLLGDEKCYVQLLKLKCPAFLNMKPDWLEKLLFGGIQDLVDKRAREEYEKERANRMPSDGR